MIEIAGDKSVDDKNIEQAVVVEISKLASPTPAAIHGAAASGDIPKIPLNLLLLKGCDAVGVFWGEAVKRDPAGHRANMRQVLEWVAQGQLHPRIHATYPLAEIRDALAVIDRREAVGKVVLTL